MIATFELCNGYRPKEVRVTHAAYIRMMEAKVVLPEDLRIVIVDLEEPEDTVSVVPYLVVAGLVILMLVALMSYLGDFK